MVVLCKRRTPKNPEVIKNAARHEPGGVGPRGLRPFGSEPFADTQHETGLVFVDRATDRQVIAHVVGQAQFVIQAAHALVALHQKYGKLKWAQLFDSAMELAAKAEAAPAKAKGRSKKG